MIMGVACGALVWRTGSLFPAILVHALYNFLIMLNVYVAYQLPW
jgi:membrane protease YdiL (CAAX protease family)